MKDNLKIFRRLSFAVYLGNVGRFIGIVNVSMDDNILTNSLKDSENTNNGRNLRVFKVKI